MRDREKAMRDALLKIEKLTDNEKTVTVNKIHDVVCRVLRSTKMADEYRAMRARLINAIKLGIDVEAEWDGPSIKPGTLSNEQISWLAAWLVSEGWVYDAERRG